MPKKKILVISGDQLMLGRYQSSLNESGYKCEIASSIVKALDILRAAPNEYQLIVAEDIDITQPGYPRGPAELNVENIQESGLAFVQYARKEGLIHTEAPVHLITHGLVKYPETPEGVTGLLRFDYDANIAEQIAPDLRGGAKSPKGPRSRGAATDSA